ncbi:aconitase family protein [Streptomyces sp. NPDC002078]
MLRGPGPVVAPGAYDAMSDGYRDLAVAADIVKGRHVADGVSLDVNPASRQALAQLIGDGRLSALVAAGARLHPPGCTGCIGMGQAPATGRRSLRTVPRNFPGRSGGGATRCTCAARRRPPPPPSPV